MPQVVTQMHLHSLPNISWKNSSLHTGNHWLRERSISSDKGVGRFKKLTMKKERTEPTNNIRKHEKINTETKQTKVKIKKTDNLNIL